MSMNATLHLGNHYRFETEVNHLYTSNAGPQNTYAILELQNGDDELFAVFTRAGEVEKFLDAMGKAIETLRAKWDRVNR